MRRIGPAAALTALLLWAAGCGDPPEKFVPVSGRATVNGRPLPKGDVIFVPDSPDLLPYGMGQVAADGSYSLTTNGTPGAKVGKYKVMVQAHSNPFSTAGDWVPVWMTGAEFTRTETTPLRIEVVENPDPGAYDLKLTK